MNLIQQCLQKAVKDTETTIRIYDVDLQIKVLGVFQWFYGRHLDATKCGSLRSVRAKNYLQVSSISLSTFYLYLCFLSKRYMDRVAAPTRYIFLGCFPRWDVGVDKMRNWGKRKRLEMESVDPRSQVHYPLSHGEDTARGNWMSLRAGSSWCFRLVLGRCFCLPSGSLPSS